MARIVDLLKGAALAVGGTDVAYSFTFPNPSGQPAFAFEYQATSSGTVALKLEVESGNTVLETDEEKAAHNDYVVAENAIAFDASLADENTHIKAYAPPATSFTRVKVTGLAGNDASTVLSKLQVAVIK